MLTIFEYELQTGRGHSNYWRILHCVLWTTARAAPEKSGSRGPRHKVAIGPEGTTPFLTQLIQNVYRSKQRHSRVE